MRFVRRVAPAVAVSAVLSGACTEARDLQLQPASGAPPAFESQPEAGVEAAASPAPLMCPVTECSPPRTTCPSSKFPCDVDLSRDNDNCGACGVRCWDGVGTQNWTCVDGRCTFACQIAGWADCDGEASNGCEVFVLGSDNDNCGGCGIACPDGLTCTQGSCTDGCATAKLPDRCSTKCTNLAVDDANCGTCGTACDRSGPDGGISLPQDMYYGCVNRTCDKPKCAVANTADCNGDLGDGCEAQLHTNDHCSGCNDKCPDGKQCGEISLGVFRCLCEDERETFCGGLFTPFCRRLDDDPQNCGGCDHICPGVSAPNFSATCTHGVCEGACTTGFADCDSLAENGCEVDLRIDNRNCGACGKACLPAQVCSEGQCLFAPCDAGAPGDVTR